MENLRITEKNKFVDMWGTGDSSSVTSYEVRRDFTPSERNRFNCSESVIKSGVIIETFKSEVNAHIFLTALIANKINV